MSLEHLDILYDATRAAIGLVVETNDAGRLRQRLYAARADHPDLANLAFVISPLNGVDLWILNKGPTDEG